MPQFLRQFSATTLALLAFLLAATVMVGVAYATALVIETRTAKVVSARLAEQKLDWITVTTDGLQVHLTGTAPNEAARFRAVNMVGTLVDNSRIRDGLEVAPTAAIKAPDFSVQMLRTEDGIQLFGLMPENPGENSLSEAELAEAAGQLTPGIEPTNMLELADYPAPETWGTALAFGLEALKRLPRSKVSVMADRVEVTAISDSAAEKRRLENELRALAPQDVRLVLDISAPRPVITPFTLRFVVDTEGARFDSCSADTERAQRQILAAATAAGVTGTPNCRIGLGTPTPRWAEAVVLAIRAVKELGSGSITFSDADVTLLAGSDVPQATFDKVVGELETSLPDAFSLTSTLEKAESSTQGPAEFTAVLTEAGKLDLRGRLTDELQRQAVDAFARAAFEGAEVRTATRVDETLPDGWPLRVLAGLEALAEVEYGSLLVRADTVEVTGVTGSQETRGRITQILSGKLGQGQTFRVNVRYDKALDPVASLPTPEECAADVNAVIARTKITFTPASAELAAGARPVLDELAAILTACPPMQMEIAGHTDSQGSEGGNKALSQARAEAVLMALQGRRVDISGMTAVGYGESTPIADNATEEGREANRRIEFVLKGDHAAMVQDAGVAPAEGTAVGADGAALPPAGTAGPGAAPATGGEGPDFSNDTSPSVAPAEKTIRPLPRPADLKAGEDQ
ncbi:OmpA family protein [Tabrizicola caldifontis]|uniref:OmpA family protein n=1 Tax=Tabrizicola caldifontis TaxID=2528036 RepID=UPI001F1065B7|nr:OmpA family protein [Rhodobacter sp. YIM 73028]